MGDVRVAVVDVGANTLRLLVAARSPAGLERIREERRRIALGEDVERFGVLTPEKVGRCADAARKMVRRARKLRVAAVAVVVTSPWRDAENGDELVAALAEATELHVRAVSAEEEAELGFVGALAMTPVEGHTVAVCDVGGGSTQIAIGGRTPSWLRSVPIGSLRLTERCIRSNPPTPAELAAARAEAHRYLGALTPPLPSVALATGGTARALRRYGLDRLDARSLDEAVVEIAALRVAARAKRARVDLERARTLPVGAIILAEVQRLLHAPVAVADGGVREGVCSTLLEAEAATGT